MTTPVPPVTPSTPTRFFASYFDVVTYPTNPDPTVVFPVDNWSKRWQWIVMPRLPEAHSDSVFWVFQRHQHDKSHRAIWRNSSYRNLDSVFDGYVAFMRERSNRVAREPIVVELSERELRDYIDGSRKTPWEVIKRAQRAARKLGYTI